MKRFIVIAVCFLMAFGSANAAIVDFNLFGGGPSPQSFDGDGDGVNDVTFTSGDGSPFNATGPGPNMTYIVEPGLEGAEGIAPELIAAFPFGAVGQISFGFAVDTFIPGETVTFEVFDSGGVSLGSTTVAAAFTDPPGPSPVSSFPEGEVILPFTGVAASATFDFSGTTRYIIDNFAGTYGSTERLVIDIKPGSCPNPLNPKSKGVLPVAIVGTLDFNPADVDLSTVLLEGVAPVKAEILDSTEPGDYDPADCYNCFNADDNLNYDADGDGVDDTYIGDGIEDLVLYFDTQELVDAIGSAEKDECLELTLTGNLLDGTAIQGTDSVVVLKAIQ